jgi:hypothetical protein
LYKSINQLIDFFVFKASKSDWNEKRKSQTSDERREICQ